jgi:hypothetical protein
MKPDTPEIYQRQHDRPAVCYRPTVFFRHLSIITLLFPHGKILFAFQKCHFNFLKRVRKIANSDY